MLSQFFYKEKMINMVVIQQGMVVLIKGLGMSLNKLSDNLNELNNSNIEVVLCDWGSEKR
jgi:hypothetical protein